MLTEPVTCSSCGAVSVNGGTLHCHGCYKRLWAENGRLKNRVAELEAERAEWERRHSMPPAESHTYPMSPYAPCNPYSPGAPFWQP